jgi:hypothetical protein
MMPRPGSKFVVFDLREPLKPVGFARTLAGASRRADQLDAKFGGVRYAYRPISPTKPTLKVLS